MSEGGPPLTRRRAASVGGMRTDRRERRRLRMESERSSASASSSRLTRKDSDRGDAHKRNSAVVEESANGSEGSKRARRVPQASASAHSTKRNRFQKNERRDYLMDCTELPAGAARDVNIFCRVIGIRRYRPDDAIKLCFEDDFMTEDSRNGVSSSDNNEYLKLDKYAIYGDNESLLTVFPRNCFDVIVWDGQTSLGLVVHPKFSDVIHKGIIALDSAIQILSVVAYHLPGSLEKKEGTVITDLRLLSSTNRRVTAPQQLPTSYEQHELLPRPALAKRPHYLPMLADDLMQEVWSWKVLKKRIKADNSDFERPTTPTLVEIMNADRVEVARRAAKARVRECLRRLSIADTTDIATMLDKYWNGVLLSYSQERLDENDFVDIPLIGRVVWVTRVLYYASSGSVKEPSYKLNIRLMDASHGIDVVCWGHASAFYDASLRRIVPGSLIGVRGYRKKKFRVGEVSLNESNPTPNIFLVKEPCETSPSSMFPFLSSDDALASYVQMVCRFPLPEYRWTAMSSLQSVSRDTAFSVAGLVTSVGPVKRCTLDVIARARHLSDTHKGDPGQTVWLTCRNITLLDHTTRKELTILLFANSDGRRFFRLKPGIVIGVSHLVLGSSEEQAPSLVAVSCPASRIFAANDLQRLAERHSSLKGALNTAGVSEMGGVAPPSYEYLKALVQWVQDIEHSDLSFNVIGNPSVKAVEDLGRAPAMKLDHSSFTALTASMSAQMKGTTRNDKKGVSSAFNLGETLLLSIHEDVPEVSESIPSVYEGGPFVVKRSCSRPNSLSAYQKLLSSAARLVNSYSGDVVTESMESDGRWGASVHVGNEQELPLMDLRRIPSALKQLFLLESCQVVSVGRIVDFIPPEVCKLALFTKNASQATASAIAEGRKKVTVVQAVSHQMTWLWETCHCLLITALRLWAGVLIVEDLNRQVQVAVLVPAVPTFPMKDELPRRYNPDTRSMTDLFTDPDKCINEPCVSNKAVRFAVMQHVELEDIDSCTSWLEQYLPEGLKGGSLAEIGNNARKSSVRLAFCLDLRNNGAQQGAFPHLETVYELNDDGEGV
eukprot:gb/GECG01006605.1/.p1 GENE.gb/GECG01006605.1/~~gb/GECG01006605.1/.p1  ORF type:complete len:1059 (+),score=89.02 gb/GECG01006605.1/:1-3177(+)